MNLKPVGLIVFVLCVIIIFSISCSFFEEPDTPSGLTAVYNATTDAVELKWKDVDGASDYTVFRGANENSLTEFKNTNHPSYDDLDYNYYEPYYAVRAENNFGKSGISAAVLSDVLDHDKYEPDNSLQTATEYVFSGDDPSQKHSIMPDGDVDFIKFYASPSFGYNIEIPAASAIPVKITLYDASGTELRSDSEGSGIYIARIGEWSPASAGWYYIKIEAKNIGGDGYYRIFVHQWT